MSNTNHILEVEYTKSAADDYGDPIKLSGLFDFSFYGDGIGTVAIQRSIEDPDGEGFSDSEFKEIQTYEADGAVSPAKPGEEPTIAWYRAGFNAYTSGDTTFVFRIFRKGVRGDL